MPSLIEKARTQAETARDRLNAALVDGNETATLRAQLEAAEARLRQAEGDESAARTYAAAEDEPQLHAAALALADEARTALAARLADASRLPSIAVPDVPTGLARALVDVRALRASQQSAIAEHAAQGARIRERIAEIDRQRETITNRRLDGDQRPNDAAEQALLAADREGLQRLLTEHTRQTPPAPVDPSVIETEWHATLLAREATALHDYAEQVQHHLIALAQQLVALSKGKNGYRLRINLRLREAAQRGIF
jgi:hypothetical protein